MSPVARRQAWGQVSHTKVKTSTRGSTSGVQVERLALFVGIQDEVQVAVGKEKAAFEKQVRRALCQAFHAGYGCRINEFEPKHANNTIVVNAIRAVHLILCEGGCGGRFGWRCCWLRCGVIRRAGLGACCRHGSECARTWSRKSRSKTCECGVESNRDTWES